MTIDQLKEVHQASPFRPFVLRMADGTKISVRHREFLSHSRTGRTVIVHQENDHYSVLDVLMITEIEVLSRSEKRSRGNGR